MEITQLGRECLQVSKHKLHSKKKERKLITNLQWKGLLTSVGKSEQPKVDLGHSAHGPKKKKKKTLF